MQDEIPFQTPAEYDAERAVLGICLAYPERVVDVTLEAEHFGNFRHQATWRAVRALSDEGRAIDPVLVADEITRGGGSDRVGMGDLAGYLLALYQGVVTGHNVSYYTDLVRNSWARRRVANAAGEIIVAAKEAQLDGSELVDLLLQKIADIETGQPDDAVPMPRLVKERLRQLLALVDAKAKGEAIVTGLPTGIRALDKVIGGLQFGIVTVVAGRPGAGKSSMGLTVAETASAAGKGVHVFSMEDIREAYIDRALSKHSGVPIEKLRTVDLVQRDLPEIARASNLLGKRGTWLVDDRSGLTPEEIVRSVRRHRKSNGTECVVVDYAQIIRGQPKQERFDVVSRAMDILADAAKQDRLVYLVLAQLNRDCEKREDKRPLLADLKQSGSIEERSKCVMMLYRDKVYNDDAPDNEIEILIRKNNQGQIGAITARWNGPTTTISDMPDNYKGRSDRDDDDWRR